MTAAAASATGTNPRRRIRLDREYRERDDEKGQASHSRD